MYSAHVTTRSNNIFIHSTRDGVGFKTEWDRKDFGRRRSETEKDSGQRRIKGGRGLRGGGKLRTEKEFRLNRIQGRRRIKDRDSGWSRIQAGKDSGRRAGCNFEKDSGRRRI